MSIFKHKKTNVEKVIDSLIEVMGKTDPSTEAYSVMAKNLEILTKAKDSDKGKKGFSWDTILVVAGNLLGIGLILGYEKLGVISSKAIGFILKGRV